MFQFLLIVPVTWTITIFLNFKFNIVIVHPYPGLRAVQW